MKFKSKIIIVACILGMLVTGCGNQIDFDKDKSVPVVYFSEKNCYLNFLTGESINYSNKIKMNHDSNKMGYPVYCQKVGNEVCIAIGNYNDEPIDYYVYDGEKNKITNNGILLSTVCCFCNTGNMIFVVKREATEDSSKFYLEGYDIDNIEEPISSVEVYGAPGKMLYDDSNDAIYMYTIGNEDATVVEKYDINSQEQTKVIVDKVSYAADMEMINDNIYMIMSGWSEEENVIYDNRLVVYDKELNFLDEYEIDDAPEKIDQINDYIYIYYSRNESYILKYDKEMNYIERYEIPNSYIMTSIAADNIVYYYSEDCIYLLTERGILTYPFDGTISTTF